MEPSDRTRIERHLGGDRAAFGEIVTRWQRPVLNLAYRLTGDLEEARDIRQLAFLRALRALPSFNGEARFSTWIYRIVVNLCRDRMRVLKTREAAMQVLKAESRDSEISGIEGEPEREETARLVAKAVAGLPAEEREIVVLKHYHGHSFSEIAAVVGAPVSTVKSRMERGLRNLRARLKNLKP